MARTRRSEAVWIESRSRWQINVQRDGKRKTFTSTLPGRKGKHEAEGKADDWLESGQPDDLRFDRAWDIYLTYLQKTTGTANYTDNESIGRNWLLPELGTRRLSKIRISSIQSILDNAAEAGRSARTCKNIKDKFFGFHAYAQDQKWSIDDMQSRKVKVPSKAPQGTKTVVQPDQIKTVFSISTETCREKVRECFYIHAFRFFIIGGMRSGELCGFKRSDFTGDALIINRSFNRFNELRQGKNENALRTIPLTSYAQHVLEDQENMLRRHGIKTEWLFPDEHGEHLQIKNLYRKWKFYSVQHGIDTSIHELRHTFISMTQKALPEPLLKRIVGHSANMDTDGVYGHEMDGDLQTTVQIMENLLDRIIGSTPTE